MLFFPTNNVIAVHSSIFCHDNGDKSKGIFLLVQVESRDHVHIYIQQNIQFVIAKWKSGKSAVRPGKHLRLAEGVRHHGNVLKQFNRQR